MRVDSVTAATSTLIRVMRFPEESTLLSPADWNQVLPIARAANVLGTLGERISKAGCELPHGVRRHLDGMAQLSARQRESVRWEAHQLARALAQLGIPVLLLKGAAYVLGEIPVSMGRLFGDIDILVPRRALSDVEIALMTEGWTSTKLDPYDQRYYREWMHELPPMLHVRRGTVLDIHHTLLPLTSRHTPDPARLLERSIALSDLAPLRIPCPEDLVIHSITHLFHEGELHNGLRDLFDIDALLTHFGQSIPGFWARLVPRAESLQLMYPLFLGLHFAQRLLGTPVPGPVLADAARLGAPSPFVLGLLEALFDRGLQPMHPACDSALTPTARWLLYVRAHWLRMPPHLLTMHLTRKAWKGLFPKNRPVSMDNVAKLP